VANETRLAVILHADIIGSTELVQKDERLTHERIRSAFLHLAERSATHDGLAHEIRGDALVAEFKRPSDAVSAAMEFQREHGERIRKIEDGLRPEVRIGIAMGEVIIADDTITGAGVVLAQRLEQLASSGGVCISAAVREAVPGRLAFSYETLGEHVLKGFNEPVRLFAVAMQQDTPSAGDKSLEPANVPSAGPKHLSIAVLPFENLSSDPDQDYFGDGLAEDIITELSRFRSFLVIARNTTFSYKGQGTPILAIAAELAARYVVVGSVRRAGTRVRVNAQLTDGVTGSNIWAERYDRSLDDIFAVQDELTEAIVTAIAPESLAADSRRAAEAKDIDLGVWDLVMRARWELAKHTRAGNVEAHRLLEQALLSAPSNESALVYLSLAHSWDALNNWGDDVATSRTEALSAARQAVASDGGDALAHAALGAALLMSRSHSDAILALERAVELNPNLAEAHGWLSSAVANVGDYEKARASTEAALRLSRKDPERARWQLNLSVAAMITGRNTEVISLMTEVIREFPQFHIAYRQRAAARSILGQLDEAKADLARCLEIEPNQSAAAMRSQVPFQDLEALERYIGALQNIGLPD